MPRRIGLTDIATLLDVHEQTAYRYSQRDDFPQPIEQLPTGRVWDRADVQKWAKATLPLRGGRPRKPPEVPEGNWLDLQDRSLIERRLVGAIRLAVHANGPITVDTAPSAAKRAYSALKQIAGDQRRSSSNVAAKS